MNRSIQEMLTKAFPIVAGSIVVLIARWTHMLELPPLGSFPDHGLTTMLAVVFTVVGGSAASWGVRDYKYMGWAIGGGAIAFFLSILIYHFGFYRGGFPWSWAGEMADWAGFACYMLAYFSFGFLIDALARFYFEAPKDHKD